MIDCERHPLKSLEVINCNIVNSEAKEIPSVYSFLCSLHKKLSLGKKKALKEYTYYIHVYLINLQRDS